MNSDSQCASTAVTRDAKDEVTLDPTVSGVGKRVLLIDHEDSFDAHNLLSRGQEIVVDVAEADKVAVELAPGHISLHHGLTIHGSGPNQSDDRRIGVAIRYVSAKMRKAGGDKDYAISARGTFSEDSFETYKPPVALFDPSSLDWYEKIRAEQAKVMMAGAQEGSAIY